MTPTRRRGRRTPAAAAWVAPTVTGVGLASAVLMVVADLLPIVSVDVASGSCEVINDSDPGLADACVQSGFERHGPALLLLGLASGVMSWGAGLGRSGPAAVALCVVGVVVLAIGLLIDLPVTDDTGRIGTRFAGASARAEIGFPIELLAGASAALAGGLRLMRPAEPPRGER